MYQRNLSIMTHAAIAKPIPTEADSDDQLEYEWFEWYRMTPSQRSRESHKLWSFYLQVGGSLDPEPDTQSPFDDASTPRAVPADGRPGVRVVRRGGV